MNKEAFLKRLDAILMGLPEDDKQRSLDYYAEVIADRMEDGMSEEDAVAALGAPEAIAVQILRDAGIEPDPSLLPPSPEQSRAQKIRLYTVLIALVVLAAVWRFGVAEWLAGDYTMQSVMLKESISAVDADLSFYNIQILADSKASVRYPENKLNTCEVEVKKGKLVVKQKQRFSFLNIFLPHRSDDLTVTLYLPADACAALTVETASGDVSLNDEFRFQTIAISTTSGDVTLGDLTGGAMSLSSTSGSIALQSISGDLLTASSTSGLLSLKDLSLSGALSLSCTSGSIICQNVHAEAVRCKATSASVRLSGLIATKLSAGSASGTLYLTDVDVQGDADLDTTSGNIIMEHAGISAQLRAETTSGTISLADVRAGSRLAASSTSGSVDLDMSDAPDISLRTVSGNIRAALPSARQFDVHSRTGRVRCPESAGEGTLNAQSTSGNIDIIVR